MNERAAELRELAAALSLLEASTLDEQIAELGLIGIGVPETDGGSGGSLADLLVIVEEFAAQGVQSSLADRSCAQWVTYRCNQTETSPSRSTIKMLNELVWDGSGPKVVRDVPWASASDHVIFIDAVGTVCVINTDDARVEPVSNVAGEPRDTLVVDSRGVKRMGSVELASVGCRLGLLRTAATLGAAKGVYRLTKSHVAEREQFGSPLAQIPSVAGQLGVMQTLLLQLQAAFDRAIRTYEREGSEESVIAVAVARVMASLVAGDIARIGHQLHGALGTTAEHPLHRYTRLLWAVRDDDGLPRHWQQFLGRAALREGEPEVWHQLTCPV